MSNFAKNLIDQNKQNKKAFRKSYKKRFFYTFLTLVLVFGIFQSARAVTMHLYKYITINQQLTKLKTLQAQALEKNKDLKKQLKVYSSKKGIETLARNNLKMVGQDEVLVIVKK